MDTNLPMPSTLDALVQPDRARTTLYTDPAIFEAEMTRIFESSWVWVAHESEIPKPGDFKTAQVGRQPVIVVRDRKGAVHVHVNRCRHRAATVCEVHKGRTNSFVCPYHGWSYALDGSLRGVPYEKGYDGTLDKASLPLRSLRVETYAGLIFASFKADIMPLADWLGGARKWIDLFMKQGAGYPIVTQGEHRFRFPGNWKIQLENTTDAYHFPLVHRSFLTAADTETEESWDIMNKGGFVEDLGNGHSVMVMMPELVDLEEGLDAPIPERFAELAAELAKEHDDPTVRRIVRAVGGCGFNLNLFPNLGCSAAFFRVLQPISVDETEVRHVALGMQGGPAAANRARLRIHEFFQGPMGFGSPDDAEVWDRVQHGASGGPELWLMINRGLSHEEALPDGHRRSDVSAETGMRAAYGQWKRMMEG
ncbi:aromatic ring-hydroxylating dioxygenase subunit alpha [Roseomonas sp. NAR14]|uniref:Aromatic ring-hydroxylating dioxygenase subunit alpha n=1 Tax=Roseomonas acroporae TaxID=2937791 RepID=A0A9X2BUT5_9PROT|nr:aromatic ring-hydroxylating dioxygenase subunit alpha [Roseomonas acroporae]MCK8785953.1 aromatic ring-hydroxylating dioxygenase subunit alpha [Roseomonas acroporae]